jgi:dethiobiotin synthetase
VAAFVRELDAELVIVEGAGGLLVRFDDDGGTLADVAELFAGDAALRRRPPRVGTRVPGLRGGTARWAATGTSLRRVQYVPGVVVSGLVPHAAGATARLRVTGAAAARGTLRVLAGGRIVGRLDGRRVSARGRPLPAVHAAGATGFRAGPAVVRQP